MAPSSMLHCWNQRLATSILAYADFDAMPVPNEARANKPNWLKWLPGREEGDFSKLPVSDWSVRVRLAGGHVAFRFFCY